MKTKIIRKALEGFTLLELMITIAIIAVLVTLATPSSFYQQTAAVNYADRALQQAKVFSNYISDNYSSIYSNAYNGGSPITISITASAVDNVNYWGGLSQTDNYGATPCATVSYNTDSKKLNMYMYYVGGSAANSDIIASANNYLSGVGGKLDSTGTNYVGAFNSWSATASSITTGGCGTPVANGLAINLNSLITQVSNMQGDNSLHRVYDPSNIGTATNYNTMQTDIIMAYTPSGSSTIAYNGIYFSDTAVPGTSPYLTSGANTNLISPYNTGVESDIVAANATLVANSFVPSGTATINQSCVLADIGKIMKNGATPTANIPQSDLMCTYNTVVCTVSNPCYLSVGDTASRIRTNTITSNTYTCQAGTGNIDRSVLPVYGNITSPNTGSCKYNEIGPRVFTYTTNSVSVTTTWLLIYYTGSGGCAATNFPTNGNTTVGTGLITNSTAVAIAAAACTQ